MPWLKEIYHYLQSKSKVFPWVDYFCFREEFLKKIGVSNQSEISAIEQLVMKNTISGNRERGTDNDNFPSNALSRYMFLEMVIRIGQYLYISQFPELAKDFEQKDRI